MKKVVFGIAFAVIIIAAGLWIAQTDEGTTSTGPTVGATIFPIYDIARTIGGDEFNVVLILPAGASPHTFDPQPSTLKNLQGAQAVFAIGHTLDNWATNVAQAVDAPVVVVDHGIALRETVEQGHDHEEAGHDDHDAHDDHDEHEEDEHGHAHGPTDPHYWLSPMNATQITCVASELTTSTSCDTITTVTSRCARIEPMSS